ncbi:FMN-binding protein [Pseudoalteromonas xiamenensis]|uniref:FMN-binding protein n=1 Tax=Pseudoalteromonas xiamenensis TaxID=882626 RepID=UPI0027E479D7|nr:FMN-binding protein [Pseudoalteromonas xiamenensis]WMN60578.1 FMN-binding protein [Pseudoalteromonas xiamenensis]
MRPLPSLIALGAAATCQMVYAADYLTVTEAQQLLFPSAVAIDHKVAISEEQKDQIKALAGVRQRFDEQEVYKMDKDGKHVGWTIIDNVVGKHEFITYAVGIDATGKVTGIEVLSYRETHGAQIRMQPWRDMFVGKTLNDKFKLNKDIPNISGATLSCRNVTDGVKRILALHQIVLQS